jgi:DNA-binding MarR family transcriptional regulator
MSKAEKRSLSLKRILEAIEDGCFTIEDIAEATQLHSSWVGRLLPRLVKAKLVKVHQGQALKGDKKVARLFVLADAPQASFSRSPRAASSFVPFAAAIAELYAELETD